MTILSVPSKNTAIGKFESNGADDIFQIIGPNSSVLMHMNADGSIDPPIFPVIKKVTLTAAQLNGLHATPAILIPAPGPGLYLLPQSITAVYNFKTTPFTVTGGDQFLYYGWQGQAIDTSASLGTFNDAGFVDQNSSQVQVSTSFSNQSTALAQIVNKALVLGINDVLSNGDGTMSFVISYTVTAV